MKSLKLSEIVNSKRFRKCLGIDSNSLRLFVCVYFSMRHQLVHVLSAVKSGSSKHSRQPLTQLQPPQPQALNSADTAAAASNVSIRSTAGQQQRAIVVSAKSRETKMAASRAASTTSGLRNDLYRRMLTVALIYVMVVNGALFNGTRIVMAILVFCSATAV